MTACDGWICAPMGSGTRVPKMALRQPAAHNRFSNSSSKRRVPISRTTSSVTGICDNRTRERRLCVGSVELWSCRARTYFLSKLCCFQKSPAAQPETAMIMATIVHKYDILILFACMGTECLLHLSIAKQNDAVAHLIIYPQLELPNIDFGFLATASRDPQF